MSFLAAIDNRTPFDAQSFVLPDPQGQETTLIVLSASFCAPRGGELELDEQQRRVRLEDEPWGTPGASSPRYENDLALHKPFVDVLVNGSAYAPEGRPARWVAVEVMVGDVRKSLVVHGERVWALWEPTRGKPFETMPIVYERAFGGPNERGQIDPRNPVGVGLGGVGSSLTAIADRVPNVEYADAPVSRFGANRPAAYGSIDRGWAPRIGFAGTYDQAWLESRWPLLPEDFDARHYQAAPLDQQSCTIRGGEPAHIVHMTPGGVWRFRLPTIDVPVHLLHDDRQERTVLRIDTVLIEPDEHRVTLTARVAVKTARTRGALREVVLGHVRPGWLRARAARKRYIDHSGHHGTDPSRPTFSP